jgi:hypothetical protein
LGEKSKSHASLVPPFVRLLEGRYVTAELQWLQRRMHRRKLLKTVLPIM